MICCKVGDVKILRECGRKLKSLLSVVKFKVVCSWFLVWWGREEKSRVDIMCLIIFILLWLF